MSILQEQDIRQALGKMAPPPESAMIKTPMQVCDQVVSAFHNPSFGMQGYPVHFDQFADRLRFRAGEVTIWGGQNHTGKSEMLNQFLLSQTGQTKAFIMSPEMPVYRTLQYMTQQITRVEKPSEEKIRNFMKMIEGKIYLLDQSSTFKASDIEKLVRFAHSEYGCFHFAIDSLMKCGMDENKEHAQIRDFVDNLCQISKSIGVHTHLVAHCNKPKDNQRPNRYDIKGTGAIPDLVDNVILMWRNEEKERVLDEGGKPAHELMEWEAKPDGRMIVDKQRHGTSWKGSINLWHCAKSRSFDDKPSQYVPDQYRNQ